jgi:pimeloyl-ACP methyl ester carboxylesterase
MKKRSSTILIKLHLVLLVLFGITINKSFCQGANPYHPTGKLVDAGGHRLHIHVLGKGGPIVIFENGSADFSWVWDLVQPEISQLTKTVSYDRAGYAWSEPGPMPRTGKQIAYELHTALQHAGIKGPYILVGQSFGGFLIRDFSRFYKKDVVGMVLVDVVHEDEKIMINGKAIRVREMATGRKAPPVQAVKKNMDTDSKKVNPLVANTNLEPPLDKLPPYDQKLQLWAKTQFNYFKAVSSEMDWSPEDVADMYKNRNNLSYKLGNIPLIVISKGNGDFSGAEAGELEKQRIKLQNDLTYLSTNSKHIIDKKSGHNIHLEDPSTVIRAIKEVLYACKTNTQLE